MSNTFPTDPKELEEKLAEYEDAASAIAVYKRAHELIQKLNAVKQSAIQCAEADLTVSGIKKLETPMGNAGWTKPKKEVVTLRTQDWEAAKVDNPTLADLEEKVGIAQKQTEKLGNALRIAKAVYSDKKLPEGKFYIR